LWLVRGFVHGAPAHAAPARYLSMITSGRRSRRGRQTDGAATRRRWPGVSAALCLGRPARRTPGHTRTAGCRWNATAGRGPGTNRCVAYGGRVQDSWRPCGDRGLFLLASSASVQRRDSVYVMSVIMNRR
jgi:hypothetical protein